MYDFFLDSWLGLWILFGVSALLMRVYSAYALKKGVIDVPNGRSLHTSAKPRGGGIVFMGVWLLSVAYALGYSEGLRSADKILLILLGASALLMTGVGFLEDFYGLGVGRRLLLQSAIALVFVGGFMPLQAFYLSPNVALSLGYCALPFTVVALVAAVNSYNFMDGLDGFAALEAVFIFTLGGALFWAQGSVVLAFVNWSLVACVLGFLVWNWPKARLFMGDGGSYALGFCVAAFAVIGDQRYGIPIGAWILGYSVFLFDAAVTLLRRVWRRENITTAHCLHAYQRLYKAGVSNHWILGGLLILNSLLVGVGIFIYLKPKFLGVGSALAVILLASVYGIIEKINPMWEGSHDKTL